MQVGSSPEIPVLTAERSVRQQENAYTVKFGFIGLRRRKFGSIWRRKKYLDLYSSEKGTAGSIRFPRRTLGSIRFPKRNSWLNTVPKKNSWFNTVPKEELLFQHGSEEGTPGSIRFRKELLVQYDSQKELLFQYGSEEGTLVSIRFRRRNSWFNTVPKRNSCFNTVPKKELLVQYGSEKELLH
jgi:hypothetical protein